MNRFGSALPVCTAVGALLSAGLAQAACYTVLDGKGAILSRTSTPPVDMSLALGDVVPQRYGAGATMVFSLSDPDCGPVADPLPDTATAAGATAAGATPRRVRAPKADRG